MFEFKVPLEPGYYNLHDCQMFPAIIFKLSSSLRAFFLFFVIKPYDRYERDYPSNLSNLL